jgi:ferric-chelate reductase (NADPH)
MSMGRVEKAVLALFTKQASVTELRRVSEQFSLITLRGDALRGVSWIPGQKIQVQLGGFVQRTFTPLSWDAVEGSTVLLVYLHGDGPAVRWARALEIGTPCSLFGPRASLDLNALDRKALLFGDETSFGLAHALRFTSQGSAGVELLLEVSSLVEAEQALQAVGVTGAHLVERRPGDAHLGVVEETAEDLLRRHSLQSSVLSGKATSIQKLNRRLRALGLSRQRIRTKAYWAPGKKGLD